MSHFGSEIVGERLMDQSSIVYHAADKNGRMFFCRCMPSIRIGKRLIHCFGKRNKITRAMSNRLSGCYY